MSEQFKQDVDTGLSNQPKKLSSKYFYDKKGDALFVKIMNMPEYYLTRAEHEIFREQTSQLIENLDLQKNTYFELIELGAGDGTKTKELLKALDTNGYQFSYLPIDISQNALNQLEVSLAEEMPNVKVKKQQGDYFQILASLKESEHPKVILFLGSNLGNMKDEIAGDFIYKLGGNLKSEDKLLLGLDLIKPEKVVLPAYFDKTGITSAFNLNLLERINRELGADFNLDTFRHIAQYTESEGIARSFLESTEKQEVNIQKIGKSFTFEAGERIHTEISRKYNSQVLQKILKDTDFQVIGKLTDSNEYFADYVLKRR